MPTLYITNASTGRGLNGVKLELKGQVASDHIVGVTKNDYLGGALRDGVFTFSFPSANRSYTVFWSGPGIVSGSEQVTLSDSGGGFGIQVVPSRAGLAAALGSLIVGLILVR